MSEIEREENGDEGGVEKRDKMDGELKVLKALEKKDLKEVEAILRSEFKKKIRMSKRGATNLHLAAYLEYVEVLKILIRQCIGVGRDEWCKNGCIF